MTKNQLLIFIYILIFTTSVTGTAYKDTCIVSSYHDVAAAAKDCSTVTLKDIVIPEKTTMLIELNEGANLIFDGHITHEPAEWPGVLIKITGTKVTVSGTSNHLLDGMGPKHWKGSDASISKPRLLRLSLKESVVENLHLKNCPVACISIASSDTVVSNILIDNKDGYPGIAGNNFAKNTDGFDVSSSSNLTVQNSVVYNQDDCVAVNGGHNLLFQNLWCNGSHGFSLSVRSGDVYDVKFKNCHMEYANNAIHIKTHNDGDAGTIDNILYQNITFKGIDRYAVSVQQNYPQGEARANVPITNLNLHTIKGTMTGDRSVGISIICAINGCASWNLTNIEIQGSTNKNECENAPSGIDC